MLRAASLVILAIYALLASVKEASAALGSSFRQGFQGGVAEEHEDDYVSAEKKEETSVNASTNTGTAISPVATTPVPKAACANVTGTYNEVVTATGEKKAGLIEQATQTGCDVSWSQNNGNTFAMTVAGNVISFSANGKSLSGTVEPNGNIVWENGATSVKQGSVAAIPSLLPTNPPGASGIQGGAVVIMGSDTYGDEKAAGEEGTLSAGAGASAEEEDAATTSPQPVAQHGIEKEPGTEEDIDDEAEEGINEEDQSVYSMNKLAHSEISLADKLKNVDWTRATDRLVRGLIKAFFASAILEESEKKCLRTQAGGFVSDVTGLTTDAVTALKPMVDPKAEVKKSERKQMMGLLMDGVMKVTDLVAVLTTLLKSCLKGDGMLLLNRTAKHLINFTYMEDRFLVAGVNIANAVAEGIINFEKQHFYKFGEQLGLALRKVLLSNNTGRVVLPEGMAKDEVIAEIGEGIAAGFFAPGSQVIIKDVARPDVDIDIDLNACIVENHQLFKDVFEALWTLFAQLAANAEQHQLAINATGMFQQAAPQWVNELLLALMRVPTALTRCGVMDEDMEDMFSEAMQTLGSIRFDFKFPDDKIQADKATEKVALAVEFFAQQKFKLFGKELGKLFRELLLLAFPAKYSVDVSGRLQRNLAGKGVKFGQDLSLGYVTLAVLGVAFMLLMSLAIAKTWRAVASWRNPDRLLVNAESEGEDLEVLE